MAIRDEAELLDDIRAALNDNDSGQISAVDSRQRLIDIVETMFGSTVVSRLADGSAIEPTLRWSTALSDWIPAATETVLYGMLTAGPDVSFALVEEAVLGVFEHGGGRQWPPSSNVSRPPVGYVEPGYSVTRGNLSLYFQATGAGVLTTDQVSNVWPVGGPRPAYTLLAPTWTEWISTFKFYARGSDGDQSSGPREYDFETPMLNWITIDGVPYDAASVALPAAEPRPDISWATPTRLQLFASQPAPDATGHTVELV